MNPSDATDPSGAWGDQLDPAADPRDRSADEHEQRLVSLVRDRLRDEAAWSEPPPQLRDALLARAALERPGAAEAATQKAAGTTTGTTTGPAGPVADVGGQQPSLLRPPARARRRTSWLLAAAAAVVVTAGAVALWPRGDVHTFLASGAPAAPQATAQVRWEAKSAGVAIELHIEGLQPAPPGSYYAAWVRGPSGVVPVGTFHWRKGGIPIDLWSGVSLEAYPELFVTLQQEGAALQPSDRVVLDGRAG